MYLLTDSEENDWTVTAKETNILDELKSIMFEITEDENSIVQIFDTGEQK
ncbi:MAG: hypothetical protein WA584_22325 [Pyrinomonadaceae bacterium]